MGLPETLDALLADFEDRGLPKVTPRRVELPGLPGKIDVIVGMRRSGKTYFLYQKIAERLSSGVGRSRILYLNFEDERLLPLSAEALQEIPEAFYRRHPASRSLRCWFFLDEIQNVPSWEMFLRRLVDSENVQIAVTGSSAKLLGREIATSLRGRSLTTELLPFSFGEALTHRGIEIPKRWPPPARVRSLLANAFDRYQEVGGFPEIQNLPLDLRLRVLRDYVDVVLFRDVVERHAVENVAALRYLERSLLGQPSGKFSVNRLYNDLKSQGTRVAKDSLYEYLGYLEDAYLLFAVPIASRSARVRQVNPRKIYLVDTGLARAASFRASRDTGHLLENIVYLELRRRGADVSYVRTKAGHEVDFLVQGLDGSRELVQVCADLSEPAAQAREIRSLEEAMAEHRVLQATIVTLREEGERKTAGRKTIRVRAAWRWLLEPGRARAVAGAG
jgi:predicted AAA+ superfamily ATPase